MVVSKSKFKNKKSKNVAYLLNFEFLLLNYNDVRVIKKDIFKRSR